MLDFLSCKHGEAQIALCLGTRMGLEIKPELECLHLSSSAAPIAKEGNMRSRKYTALVPRLVPSKSQCVPPTNLKVAARESGAQGIARWGLGGLGCEELEIPTVKRGQFGKQG